MLPNDWRIDERLKKKDCDMCGVHLQAGKWFVIGKCQVCESRTSRCKGCWNNVPTTGFCSYCNFISPLNQLQNCWGCAKDTLYPYLHPVKCKRCFDSACRTSVHPDFRRCIRCGQAFWKNPYSMEETCNSCCLAHYTLVLPQSIPIMDIVTIVLSFLKATRVSY
jgi:hypothetical protein